LERHLIVACTILPNLTTLADLAKKLSLFKTKLSTQKNMITNKTIKTYQQTINQLQNKCQKLITTMKETKDIQTVTVTFANDITSLKQDTDNLKNNINKTIEEKPRLANKFTKKPSNIRFFQKNFNIFNMSRPEEETNRIFNK